MHALSIAQPDVTLFLDLKGVIQQASLSSAVPHEDVQAWVGRPWAETVAEVAGDPVRRLLKDARTKGVSAFHQVAQRFPSGLELPIEYTAVRLGGKAGLVAVGKNLHAVTELQSRLISAQQAMERDYWKLREVETRYRLLFDASNEAVLLIRAGDLRIVEANPAAIRALGLAPPGRDFLAELEPWDREPFRVMLMRVREHGKAPGTMVRIGRDRRPWLVRASLMAGEPGPMFLLQLAAVEGATPTPLEHQAPPVEALVERVPDGFVVLDADGVVLRANRAFLDLVQASSEMAVLGQRLQRWLGRPGADQAVLMAGLQRHGAVRLFPTSLQGELGTETEVEISAAGDAETNPRYFAAVIRGTGPRPRAGAVDGVPAAVAQRVGQASLRELIQGTVGVVERRCIEAALEATGGNRTAAAELLGLSRQSLYAKLGRYGLDKGGELGPDPDDD